MPREALYLHFAREFGGWPEDYRQKPLDQVVYWTALLAEEADVDNLWRDVGPDGDVVEFED